jgi:hypothetical protein
MPTFPLLNAQNCLLYEKFQYLYVFPFFMNKKTNKQGKQGRKKEWEKGMKQGRKSLTFNRLHGVISQKIELFITTAVKTSNPAYSLSFLITLFYAFLRIWGFLFYILFLFFSAMLFFFSSRFHDITRPFWIRIAHYYFSWKWHETFRNGYLWIEGLPCLRTDLNALGVYIAQCAGSVLHPCSGHRCLKALSCVDLVW